MHHISAPGIAIYLLTAILLLPPLALSHDDFRKPSLQRYEVLLPIQSDILQQEEEDMPYSKTTLHNSNNTELRQFELKLVKVKFPPLQANVFNETVSHFNLSHTGEGVRDEDSWSMFTFALAAVCFGGISAHRTFVRKKHFGNKCCNNRRLENDLTFDIAFTTIPIDSSYGSFESPWTGDLEKFDV